MKKYILIFFTSFAVLTLGCKDKIEKADDLRLNNNFNDAVELYRQASDDGNAYAKWRLAEAYNHGDGVEYDESKAWSLINEAALEGCPQAACDIALSNIHGWFGIEKDVQKGKAMLDNLSRSTQDSYSLSRYALELLEGTTFDKNEEKAISILNSIKDKSEPWYCWAMAYAYFNGTENFDIDNNKAIEFLKKAYENGSRHSAFIIGNCYLNGNQPFSKDISKAVEWYEKGIKRNSTQCMESLAKICLDEDTSFANWHNITQGISLLEKAGRHGNGDAFAKLGIMYGSGTNVYKDEEKAFEYYQKSYKLRSGFGTNNLGVCYLDGTVCTKDIDKALKLFKKASDWGEGKASHNLYRYYYNPNEFMPHEINMELAKKYLLLSVKQGDVAGNLNLAAHYYYGSKLFDKNLFKAFDYFKQAADMGDINACQAVAYMYENGIGCNRNPDKSKEYADKTKPKDSNHEDE